MDTTKNQEEVIKKIECLAMLVAMTDGLQEEEAQTLEYIAGRIRLFYQAKPAIEKYEETEDIEKSISLVDLPLRVSINAFESKEHFTLLNKELEEMMANSSSAREDYEVFIKMKASEITSDFERKIALIAIEDVFSADGVEGATKKWAALVLCKEWGISFMMLNKWCNQFVSPVLERGNQFE